LRAYLTGLGQPWLEDPSNSDRRFERVRVREGLVEEARKVELAEIAVKAGRAARALAVATEQWINGQLTSYPEGFGAIPRAGFCELDPGLQRRILQRLILIYGAGKPAEPGALDYLAKWITGQGISRRTLGGAMFACRQSSVLIGREWARISPEPVIVPDSGEILWDGRFLIEAPPRAQIVPAGRLHGIARPEEIPSFVQQGLPAVLMGDGSAVIPHLPAGPGVAAKFIRHLR
jgi:tRNA(Ile)-lysidine synthase